MAKDKKPIKVKSAKVYTRAQAEKVLGKIPAHNPNVPLPKEHQDWLNKFEKHPNYHVRVKVWAKLGKPFPATPAEQDALLFSLQGQKRADISPDAAKAVVEKMRAKYFPPPPNVLVENDPVKEEFATSSSEVVG
jgi:hypothetical protein